MKGADMKSSIIIASEPLTADTTTWIELPEYTLIIANLENKNIRIVSEDIKI
jgi:glutamine amidotransferase